MPGQVYRVDVKGADALAERLAALGGDAPKRAVWRALSRTRGALITRLARWVAQATGVPVRRIRRSIHASQPTVERAGMELTLWGGKRPLVEYARRFQSSLPRSAFRAKMPQGHVGIFERRPGQMSLRSMPGRAKAKRVRPGIWHSLPIDEAYGPAYTTFIGEVGMADLLRYGGDVFKANLEHELAFREGQARAG